MELFDKIVEEYHKYMIGTLIGKEMSINCLKELCLEYNKDVPDTFIINCNSDIELIDDLKQKFKEYVRISENYE